MKAWNITNADCLTGMAADLADNSIDAIVTDPPYGLSNHKPDQIAAIVAGWISGEPVEIKGKGFMGKDWDKFVPGPEVWRECLRVLKPGGHMAVFAGSRTVDLMGLSIRLAGAEIRDQMQWIYGSGFPKSANISKMIDKAAGAERDVVGIRKQRANKSGPAPMNASVGDVESITAPSTDLAKQWDGWGTALKPAHEPIILARKPLIGTVAKNVEEHGTGGINVDGCRVSTTPEDLAKLQASTAAVIAKGGKRGDSWANHSDLSGANPVPDAGRWPANVILDEEAGALLDAQSGNRPGMSGGGKHKARKATIAGGGHDGNDSHIRSDNGGASRFFYCAKASKKEREAGLEHLGEQRRTDGREGDCDNPRLRTSERRNIHPTVKPLSLMQWLCRLITPPGGIILDPFTGSGSTGCAAIAEGFRFRGFELSEEYAEIARARMEHQAKQCP